MVKNRRLFTAGKRLRALRELSLPSRAAVLALLRVVRNAMRQRERLRDDVVQVLDPVPAQPRAFRALPSGLENTDFSSPFAVDIQIASLAGPTPFCLWVFIETDPEGIPKGVVQVPVVVTP